jgi:hypothetical protein
MRAPLRYLPDETPVYVRRICTAALNDTLLCETPPGSNRSAEIDAMNEAVGVPKGSFWCASWVSRVWREEGADVPGVKGSASCDAWMEWGKKRGTFSDKPSHGAAVLYGPNQNDATHIGIVVMLESDAMLCSVEGNTSMDGFDRNGWVVAVKKVNLKRVLGYIAPSPAANFHDARGGSSTGPA